MDLANDFGQCTLNEEWKGWMDNNQETLLEEDFVTMAFGEAFV